MQICKKQACFVVFLNGKNQRFTKNMQTYL